MKCFGGSRVSSSSSRIQPTTPKTSNSLVRTSPHEWSLTLRRHGVPITDAGSDLPWLYVTTKVKDDLFHDSLKLNETVTLRRPKPTVCPVATVWTKQSFGVYGKPCGQRA
jgi:hypothetical protein